MVINCKYCKQPLKEMEEYNLCINPKCYFYNVPVLPYKEPEQILDKPKTKQGRMAAVIEAGKGIFKDIKEEMTKTLKDTQESLQSTTDSLSNVQAPYPHKRHRKIIRRSRRARKRDPRNYRNTDNRNRPEDVFKTDFGEMDAGGL